MSDSCILESASASNYISRNVAMRNSLARSITVTDVTKSRALNPESKVSVITDANLRSWLLICYSHNFISFVSQVFH